MMAPLPVRAQSLERDVRVEVRDREGRMVAAAQVAFPPSLDSVLTDSAGVARATIAADDLLEISIRKIGFEPRTARFKIGRAPAFIIRVTLGQLGTRLPEVSVRAEYPGEPWRREFEERRRRSSGSFRDRSYFGNREPMLIGDWFNGFPGVQASSQGVIISRCPRLGVWIDGAHVTGLGRSVGSALNGVSAVDVAAIEIFRTSQQQSQYSDPRNEDCSLLIWTRRR